ncbi:MAG TPA: thioredoxin family protein [Alphaproteobacteria bacterium]|nr:thioredoxin family protein [Alphaproteobacteria bacterium]
MKSLWLRCVLALAFVVFCLPAQALTGDWQEQPQGRARLIASDQAEAGKFYAGIQLQLKPTWHTYWRSPGDAGVPPMPDWKASENLKSATLLYPLPKLSVLQGLQTYDYDGEVVFPLLIEKTDAAQGVNLKTHLAILVCADICVPAAFDLALNVPQGFTASSEATDAIKTWLARVPKVDDGQGLSLHTASFANNVVHIGYAAPSPLTEAEVIIEPGDGSVLPVASLQVKPSIIEATLGPDAPVKDVLGKEVTFTLVDKTTHQAVEKKMVLQGEGGAQMPPPAASPVTPVAAETMKPTLPAPAPMPPPNLWLMILFALIGGLILNLMPCVLPVIALKALAFASHGGGTASGVRLSFLATSAGILFSFLVMAGALIGLRQAGMSIGWGVQFQNPDFLIFLIAILLIFAANLWGFFELTLPRGLADRLSWTQGHGNLLKDFLSGAFATLLATPCSAPFLGAAVSFALAGTPAEILAIFIALGVGLAAPFLIIALFPRAATLLPKPGNWMIKMKKVLAVFLLLTAVWIAWVLSMSFMMKMHPEAEWRDFNEQEIASDVADGKTVFVDVTAAWCLTCQANARFTLARDDVKAALSAPEVVLMKADWTKPSEVIADFLRRHGRYGIPFNIVYGPATPQGQVLPELLTKEAILEALKKAR